MENENHKSLTRRLIDKAPHPEKGAVFLRDAELRGFGIRLTKGSKSFFLERRIKGRVRRLTIGPYPSLTPEEARRRAERLIGRISDGEDPAEDRIEERRGITFGRACEIYTQKHVPRKRSGNLDVMAIEKHLQGWRSRRIDDIRRRDVADLIAKIGEKHPVRANRVHSLVRKIFNFAKSEGLFEGDNPAVGVERFKERSRERFVQPGELPALFKAIRAEKDPFIQGVFLMIVFTGVRKGEALAARWEHVDLEKGIWRIPTTKADRPHLLPLPSPVVKMLKRLPRFSGNPHIFPGRKTGEPLKSLKSAWSRILEAAELQDVHIHDLRRTLGSWLAGGNTSTAIIGKILNHTDPKATAVYARLNVEPVRAVLESNAQLMLEIERKHGKKNRPIR